VRVLIRQPNRMFRRLVLAAVSLIATCTLPACTRSPDSADPGLRGHPASRPAYYEVKHEGAVYVLGNLASYERARDEGKFPARTVRRNSAAGTPVYIEADEYGMEHRLLSDYNRRHGVSKQ
jgi:hypothetical protein